MSKAAPALCWTLPWPTGVSANHLYKRTWRGGLSLSAEYVAWRDVAILTIRQSFIDRRATLLLPLGRLSLTVRYWPPKDQRKHDPDNLLKATIDSVFKAFLVDDDRLWRAEAIRQDRSETPRLLVRLEPWPKEGNDEQGH